jgi:rubrerythrin
MKKPTDLGFKNRTGIGTSPEETKELVDATREFPPSSEGDETAIARVLESYVEEAAPLGTMAPPNSLKEAAKTALKALQGERATVFLDKLGERLAFERTGTRLYDTLIAKLEASEEREGGPTLAELVHHRNEEAQHFMQVAMVIDTLGGDPTAMTPSADAMNVATSGLAQAISDPRTSVDQTLEALLVLELVDNDAWATLIELAREFADDEAVQAFSLALDQEREHLADVRRWLSSAIHHEAGIKKQAA